MSNSINALWSAEFASSQNMASAGVAVFEDGHIRGGDSGYLYIGSYELKDNSGIEGTISVQHFAGQLNSVFGQLQNFTLKLNGKYQPDRFTVEGSVEGFPEQRIGKSGDSV